MTTVLEKSDLRSLLKRYLGVRAGEAIAQGRDGRDDPVRTTSAILIADIRDSTGHIREMGDDVFLASINAMFDLLVPVIEEHEGDVLQFTGDGLLAIFPETDEAKAMGIVCPIAIERAMNAAKSASAAVASDVCPFTLGFGMSYGVVNYGNVGARDRHNFTVISAEVSRADRLQRLCPIEGSDIALSKTVSDHLPVNTTKSIGCYPLKGFSGEEEVFIPAS